LKEKFLRVAASLLINQALTLERTNLNTNAAAIAWDQRRRAANPRQQAGRHQVCHAPGW